LAYQKFNSKIIPTYRKLADYLKMCICQKLNSGYNVLPNGTAMYDYLVGVNTTTTKTPDEIYQTGLREVERITKEIDALQIKIGFRETEKRFQSCIDRSLLFSFHY
jgi:uncharacterized protein (DUF885 family)